MMLKETRRTQSRTLLLLLLTSLLSVSTVSIAQADDSNAAVRKAQQEMRLHFRQAVKTGIPYFSVSAGNHLAFVQWRDINEDRAGSVKGYNVYLVKDKKRIRLNPHLLKGAVFVKQNLTNGTVYKFQVTSVNPAGIESPFPLPIAVTPKHAANLIWGNHSIKEGFSARLSDGHFPQECVLLVDGVENSRCLIPTPSLGGTPTSGDIVAQGFHDPDLGMLPKQVHTVQIVGFTGGRNACATSLMTIKMP